MSKEKVKDGLDPSRWRTLGIIAIAQLMIILDSSIVNIALPSAKHDLEITDANQQWVITAYMLAFGSLLLLGGRIGDFIGRKKAFIIGLLGFSGASALGGLAQSQEMLFVSRTLQGAFAALLAPAALSIVSVTFIEPKERAKAFGVCGAISGGGAAIGLILGGTLTEYASWRWCLGINVPIAIVAALLALIIVKESKAGSDHSFDIPGVITATAGLFSLVYGFSRAASHGWGNRLTIEFFIAALIFLTTFIAIERRVAYPLLPMRIILERNRGGSYLGALVSYAGLFSMFLFLGLYFQVVLGYTPLHAGFAFLPFSMGLITSAGVAAKLLPRVGPRPLMITGLTMGTAGLLLLTRITPDTAYLTHVLPSLLIMSSGMALVFIPISTTVLHGVGDRDAGVASAMINTSQQVGASLGVALLNTIAAMTTTNYAIANRNLSRMFALTHGFTSAFKVSAGLLVLGALILATMIRIGKEVVVETESVTAAH